MEKELNIAAILKDKPEKTILHDIMRRINVSLYNVEKQRGYTNVFCEGLDEFTGFNFVYSDTGSDSTWRDGLQILKPSKEMQDWSKFAWKKGDVLFNSCGFQCIFKEWASNDYTKFNGCYSNSRDGYEDVQNAVTMKFQKIDNNIAYGYIREIEKKLGGKFNLETLQIDKQPKQEFKDGDIVTLEGSRSYAKCVIIFKNNDPQVISNDIHYHALLNVERMKMGFDNCVYNRENNRLATDSEKQQLFDALAKEGKVWNSETKQVEDLPKKCEFKPMDLCLMRRYSCTWELCQFAYQEANGNRCYHTINGAIFHDCIPYNDSTKHLLGTTDEWKGGEG